MAGIMRDFRIGRDTGDPWGSAMGLYFDCCNELTRRGEAVPPGHGFRVGAAGPYPRDEYGIPAPHHYATHDLERAIEVLRRYTAILRAAGMDY